MSSVHSSREMSLNTDTTETQGKQLFRHAWDYSLRVDRAMQHAPDLFSPELVALRKKLKNKCVQVMLVPCSHRRKAEELLWKKAFYDVIHLCRQHKQFQDGNAFAAYQKHLAGAVLFYEALLGRMEEYYGLSLTQLDVAQLEGIELSFDDRTLQWLRECCFQCFLHMGDIVRYQTELGVADTQKAIAYYHHAISIDPTKGLPFNGLAVLAAGKNESLDAVYYYQRSLTSPLPFEASEANLHRIFVKNGEKLCVLTAEAAHITEPDIREFTRRMLLMHFIQLQNALTSSKQKCQENLGELCERVIELLEDCLNYDEQLFEEQSIEIAKAAQSDSTELTLMTEMAVLPSDLLLKLTAMSMLPPYSLRLQGSSDTPAATAFALAVLSLLLEHCHRHLQTVFLKFLNLQSKVSSSEDHSPPKATNVHLAQLSSSMVDLILTTEEGSPKNMVEEHSDVTKQGPALLHPAPQHSVPDAAVPATKFRSKSRAKRVVDRRRKSNARVMKKDSYSSEEETEKSSSEDESTSEDELSGLSEANASDGVDVLDSLSDSSSEEEPDWCGKTKPVEESGAGGVDHPKPKQPTGKAAASKRHIVLAANFSTPAQQAPIKQTKTLQSAEKSSLFNPTGVSSYFSSGVLRPSCDDVTLEQVLRETLLQSAVHQACKLASGSGYLMAVKCFVDWLQSYPVVITTCSQSTSTMWSRLATLLNFLPSQEQLSHYIKSTVTEDLGQPIALVEDMALRGFAPLVRSQESLQFTMKLKLTNVQQAVVRIGGLHKFGQYLAQAKIAPAFSWDENSKKYLGPAQREEEEARKLEEQRKAKESQAQLNRSKLMKAMAHQRLQSEVATLEEASAKKKASLFTPYLLPDAQSLCSNLHIVKKLLKTRKFVFVISKAVIETLDGLKKGRDSYAARDVIKFLEKEFEDRNKFIRAQKDSEVLYSGKKKPLKLNQEVWNFKQFVSCALYFNQTYTDGESNSAVVTMLVDKSILDAVDGRNQDPKALELSSIVQDAQSEGIDADTLLGFYKSWQKSQSADTA